MIFMPWVRKECEKPTAHKPCRGYLLALSAGCVFIPRIYPKLRRLAGV